MELLERSEEMQASLLVGPRGANPLKWHEEERGACPLSCLGVEGERERRSTPSLVCKTLEGVPRIGTPTICPFWLGAPLSLPILSGASHLLSKRGNDHSN